MSNSQINAGNDSGCVEDQNVCTGNCELSTLDSSKSNEANNYETSLQPHASLLRVPQIVSPAPTTTVTGECANLVVDSSPRESGDDSEDESEILEESPCGRWLKRREEVDQRDVPGIDCVHLAMDTEEGVEVVWNEMRYATVQELKSQEDKLSEIFDNLHELDHQNIMKFHRYWFETEKAERPRVIFITEYMSSGSLKQFLKRTKRNAKRLPLESWRRWCTQILSALDYLHSCTPSIVHGNLTCDSIFIQHNGLVKIGSVVPDAVPCGVNKHAPIHENSPTKRTHCCRAPEYVFADELTPAADIYDFGMCALEMAALEIQPSSSESSTISEETIERTINSLEPELQRDLIRKCLNTNPQDRPTANELLFHPILFEVHSLKLLSAHCLVSSPANRTMFSETIFDGFMQRYNRSEVVMAFVKFVSGDIVEYRLTDVPAADKIEKFVEDVKYGVYPLNTHGVKRAPKFRSRAASPESAQSVKSASPGAVDVESRRIVNMMCSVKRLNENSKDILMTILLRMDDKMNRQLSCQVNENDTSADLTNELVRLGFVHLEDQEKIKKLIEGSLHAGLTTEHIDLEHEEVGSNLGHLERNWSVSNADQALDVVADMISPPDRTKTVMYITPQDDWVSIPQAQQQSRPSRICNEEYAIDPNSSNTSASSPANIN